MLSTPGPPTNLLDDLPNVQAWRDRITSDTLQLLPNSPAVLLFADGIGRPVQLLSTQQLRRLATSRLIGDHTTKRAKADIAAVVRRIYWRRVYCPFEARWWYYRLARGLHPGEYRKLVSFGPAWFIQVNWDETVPDLRVTDRVWLDPGEFIGPWQRRAACQQALDGLRDLFELCRYPEQVRRAPRGRRCAYADMGRCDAPCDGSVPMSDYRARLRAAWAFAADGPGRWLDEASTRMRVAAREQQYERAGLIKKQIAFAEHWQETWAERLNLAHRLSALVLVPVTRRRAWLPVRYRDGALITSPIVTDRTALDARTDWLANVAEPRAASLTAVERMEQTWLFSHLLFHRDADAALVFVQPEEKSPEELARCVATEIREQRGSESDSPADT